MAKSRYRPFNCGPPHALATTHAAVPDGPRARADAGCTYNSRSRPAADVRAAWRAPAWVLCGLRGRAPTPRDRADRARSSSIGQHPRPRPGRNGHSLERRAHLHRNKARQRAGWGSSALSNRVHVWQHGHHDRTRHTTQARSARVMLGTIPAALLLMAGSRAARSRCSCRHNATLLWRGAAASVTRWPAPVGIDGGTCGVGYIAV